MPTFALRGATTAAANTSDAILNATRELLSELARANGLEPGDIVSALFTVTPDLNAAFPARAARELGWTQAALLDAQAPAVPGDVPRCIRVLIHFNRERAEPRRHVYLGGARALRPDWVEQKERS